MPGGLDAEDVAHRVGHDLAGDRPEHLTFLGTQAAVAHDDEVLRIVPGRVQQGPRRWAATIRCSNGRTRFPTVSSLTDAAMAASAFSSP